MSRKMPLQNTIIINISGTFIKIGIDRHFCGGNHEIISETYNF